MTFVEIRREGNIFKTITDPQLVANALWDEYALYHGLDVDPILVEHVELLETIPNLVVIQKRTHYASTRINQRQEWHINGTIKEVVELAKKVRTIHYKEFNAIALVSLQARKAYIQSVRANFLVNAHIDALSRQFKIETLL